MTKGRRILTKKSLHAQIRLHWRAGNHSGDITGQTLDPSFSVGEQSNQNFPFLPGIQKLIYYHLEFVLSSYVAEETTWLVFWDAQSFQVSLTVRKVKTIGLKSDETQDQGCAWMATQNLGFSLRCATGWWARSGWIEPQSRRLLARSGFSCPFQESVG